MSMPWENLRAEAPSEVAIDAYVTGEATPEQARTVEQWMAEDPANAQVIETRRQGLAGLGANAQAMKARILQAVEEESAPEPAPKLSRWRRWHFWVPLGLAAAAAALVLFIPRPVDESDDPNRPITRAKGSVKLQVFRADGAAGVEVLSGAEFKAGDRLRFRATKGPKDGYLMVVGVESDGGLFSYAPVGVEKAVPAGVRDADGTLPGAVVLDGSKGEERAYLVWCAAGFALTDLSFADQTIRIPENCSLTEFVLVKK